MATALLTRNLMAKTPFSSISSIFYRSLSTSSLSTSRLAIISRLRPLVTLTDISLNKTSVAHRCYSVRPTTSSLNDPSPNWSNRPPKETILLDGCDFEHWLVVMEPPEPDTTRDDIIDSYIKTLSQVLGSEEEARKSIYSVSTKHYFAFGCLVSEELSYKIKALPKVRWVLPDSYLDVKNKDYGGEPFIDGKAVPYDPKYHEEWVRNNARANERSRRNDRPRNFDRSRNFERRRENMQNRDFQNREVPPMPNFQNRDVQTPQPGGMPNAGPGPMSNAGPGPNVGYQNRDFPNTNAPGGAPSNTYQNTASPNRDFHNPGGTPHTYQGYSGNAPNNTQGAAPNFQGGASNNFSSSGAPNTFQGGAVPNTFQGGAVPNTFQGGAVPNTFQGGAPNSFQGNAVPNTFQGGAPNTFQGGVPNTFQGGAPNTFQGGAPNTFQGGAPNTFQGGAPNTFQGSGAPNFQGGTPNNFRGGAPNNFPGGSAPNTFQGGASSNFPGMSAPNSFQGGAPNSFTGSSNAFQGDAGHGPSIGGIGGDSHTGRDMPGRD